MSTKRELLTIKEIAQMLGMSESTLHDHARQTNMVYGVPVVRSGRRVYVPRAKLMDAIYPPHTGYGILRLDWYQTNAVADLIEAAKRLDMHIRITTASEPLSERLTTEDDRRVYGYIVEYGFEPFDEDGAS